MPNNAPAREATPEMIEQIIAETPARSGGYVFTYDQAVDMVRRALAASPGAGERENGELIERWRKFAERMREGGMFDESFSDNLDTLIRLAALAKEDGHG